MTAIGLPHAIRPSTKVRTSIVPAPINGVDSRQAAGQMTPENCLYTYNIMPSEFGMQVRNGYREWALDTVSVASLGIRSMVTFEGSDTGAADDRLFAVTNEGIWDVTTYNVPPVLKFTFTDQSNEAGYGVQCHYIDKGGAEFLLYADSKNGLLEYSQATDTWTDIAGITGVNTSIVCFVTVHKKRLWMIEQNSTIGWYLAAEEKSGIATEFYFGVKFPHGGLLSALYNWTVDGGEGVDDYLVAVASSGDVIPYKGSDPENADTWYAVGTYFIGKFPKGRRFASEYAGNLYLLSAYGIIAMSDLLRGVDAKDIAAQSLSFKVARQLRDRLLRTGDLYGWEMDFIPSIGSLIVTVPQDGSNQRIQMVMSLTTEGWGSWRSVPIDCFREWRGKVYFGDINNRVLVMDVFRDNVLITPPEDIENGTPIQFSMLSSYQRYGEDGIFKQVQFIRPDFWSTSLPTFNTKALYDYDISELTLLAFPPLSLGDVWDTARWDFAIWGGGESYGQHELRGAGGIGRSVAIALRGETSVYFRLLSFDIMWTSGWAI